MKLKVKRIEVKNFKSFRDLKVELGDFNVIIGANAAGKSNFVDIFHFLKDIALHGIDNAISMRGMEYVRNLKHESDRKLSIGVWLVGSENILFADGRLLELEEIKYFFTLEFGSGRRGYRVSSERVELKVKYREKESIIGESDITIRRENGEAKVEMKNEGEAFLDKEDLEPLFPPPEEALLIRSPIFIGPILLMILQRLGIYDFDPKLPKAAIPVTGMAELEEDGENLPIVLNKILEVPEKKMRFHSMLKDLLPFIDDLDVERFTDSSLLFKVRETFYPEMYLPAPVISDGTVNVTALLTTLYFEDKEPVIIEEPEKNIHPHLIEKIVDLMREASRDKQIIVTTHSPEVVKHAGIEPLLLISRDVEGFSVVKRAMERKDIEEFLKNNIGLEDLYVQNLLEG